MSEGLHFGVWFQITGFHQELETLNLTAGQEEGMETLQSTGDPDIIVSK
jgi:hypothetical protein